MNKVVAILWGLLSLLPITYLIYFIGFVSANFSSPSAQQAEAAFDFIFRLHILTMVLIFGLLLAYTVYLFKTDHVPKDKKALWAVVLFMGNMISMPIFWYLYVWRPLSSSRSEESNAT